MFSFGVELGFHIFYLPVHSKKKYRLHIQFGGGVRVSHILSTFFTVKKKVKNTC